MYFNVTYTLASMEQAYGMLLSEGLQGILSSLCAEGQERCIIKRGDDGEKEEYPHHRASGNGKDDSPSQGG